MTKKIPFKEIYKNVPPPKQIRDCSDRMPAYFDTMWDIKYESQVYKNWCKVQEKPDFMLALAIYGYDAEQLAPIAPKIITRKGSPDR
jgi:hypothetical protein